MISLTKGEGMHRGWRMSAFTLSAHLAVEKRSIATLTWKYAGLVRRINQ
jgi:hypothetical protein